MQKILDDRLEPWQHQHDFHISNRRGEKRTRYVLVLTAITMVAEVVAGMVFGSMALLADGWHMGTHVAAFLIAIFAYRYARKHADNPAYSFGTGKVGVLGGFASAIALAAVALMMLIESVERLISPTDIQFNAAIGVAVLGLTINLISALILKDDHHHGHGHDHHHGHGHHDHNLYAAYMHVLADALTSVLAIVALVCGKYFSWHWLDPAMGIVGAAIITRWAWGLIKESSPILLDGSLPVGRLRAIRSTLEQDGETSVTDLHTWRISEHHFAAIISIVTRRPQSTDYYKSLLADIKELSHLTIEVNQYKIRDEH